MDRSQKSDAVAALNATFNESGVVVVTRNLGLTVAQSTELRGKMREAGASYKVAKNRLAKLALKDTDYDGLGDMLTGPTALATSSDPVAAAKAAVQSFENARRCAAHTGKEPVGHGRQGVVGNNVECHGSSPGGGEAVEG